MAKAIVIPVVGREAVVHEKPSEATEILGRVPVGGRITVGKRVVPASPDAEATVWPALSAGPGWVQTTSPDGRTGYVSGLEVKDGPLVPAFLPAPNHYMHDHLRLHVVHQTGTGFEVGGGLATMTTTIHFRREPPFAWDVARPQSGKGKVTTECPYCHLALRGELYSTAELGRLRASNKRGNRTLKRAATAIMLAAIAVTAAGLTMAPTSDWPYVGVFVCLMMAVFWVGVMIEGTGTGPGRLGGDFELDKSPIEYAGGGHYIAHIESW
jgi:hypothetical protein